MARHVSTEVECRTGPKQDRGKVIKKEIKSPKFEANVMGVLRIKHGSGRRVT
jgi:hypothetical protein